MTLRKRPRGPLAHVALLTLAFLSARCTTATDPDGSGSSSELGKGSTAGEGNDGSDAAAPTKKEACGDSVCDEGSYCCNALCGLCAPEGDICIQGCPDEPGKRCGGLGGVTCGEGQFCNYDQDAGGDGCQIADAQGVCQAKTRACTREYRPVCGCNGKTYGNACVAHSQGASIASEGECGAESKTCGGIAGLTCSQGNFCNYEPPVGQGCDGSIADAAGQCESTPEVCTEDYTPVCGCDRKSHSNRCHAHRRGVSVLHEGQCTTDD